MKPWWKLARPKQDIINGEDFDIGVFAIHLDQIASNSKDAPATYRDARSFFANTVFTDGMLNLTRHVHNRLSGNTDGGAVIDLNTVFGGGKTHSLVHLFHLFGNGENARKWLPKDSLDDLANHIQNDKIPKAKILTWVGTNYSHNRADSNGMVTPWGQIFGQLGEDSVAKILPFETDKTRPDTNTIREILSNAGSPVLILLDEVLSAMESMRAVNVGGTTLNESFRGFYMNLTNVASSMKGVVIVNSFSKSEGNISEADHADLQLLENVSGRVDTPIQTAQGKEIAKIIQRRLFDDIEDKEDKKSIKKIISEWKEWTLSNHDSLNVDRQLSEIMDAFESCYPFHPRVLDVFEKKWQGLGSSFGRTRGVLRMLSHWINRAYHDAFENNRKDTLIMLGHAPLHETKFANTVYGQMGNNDLSIPIDSDVAGDNSHARKLDEEAQTTIQNLSLHRQVATAVFFESTGGQKMNRARTGEIKWGVCGPNSAQISDVDTCLKNLENRGHYFRSKNDTHYISTKANLNKLILEEKATIEEKDVITLIENTIIRQLGKSDAVAIKPNVRYSEDVPDDVDFKICVLPFDILPGSGKNQSEDIARKILNGSNRRFKRQLSFLSCTNNLKLKSLARTHLTYKSIKDKSNTYQLDKSDKADLPNRVRISQEELMDEVWNSYRTLYLGESDGSITDYSSILGLINRSMSSQGIVNVIVQRFTDRDLIINKSSHRVIEKWPPAFKTENQRLPWTLQSLRDNIFQSSEVSSSRLTKVQGLKSSIMEWIKSGKVVLVSVNEDGSLGKVLHDENTTQIELSSLVSFNNTTGILLPSDIPKETAPESGPEPGIESEPKPEQGFSPESDTDHDHGIESPEVVDEVEMTFTVSAKKLNSIGMAMSMNFDGAIARIEFKGKPRKGTVSNPVSALKDAINSAGGEIED